MLRARAFAIPMAPLLLTLGGLVPFIGGAALMALAGEDVILKQQAMFLLLGYGALILSFLGGVRWGLEMAPAGSERGEPRFLVLAGSVMGALVGWGLIGLFVLHVTVPKATLFLALATALTLHWAWDLSSRSATPAWYDGLRSIATSGAVGSLLVAWWLA